MEYTRQDLVDLTGINTHQIHKYLKMRLLPPGTGYGTACRYSPAHVRRLRLIQKLHDPERLTLREVKALIDKNPEYAFR